MFPNPTTNSPWGPSPHWAPGGPDWLWFATAGLLALLVLVLMYFAVWRGRSRGRRRCPKCWYDMAGAEGIGHPPSATGGEASRLPDGSHPNHAEPKRAEPNRDREGAGNASAPSSSSMGEVGEPAAGESGENKAHAPHPNPLPSGERGQMVPLTCPECGTRITKPRKLRKTRIRWKLVAMCMLLALVATASGLLPKVRRDGPLSVAPNELLIWLIEYEMQLDRSVRYEDTTPNQPQKIRSISTSLGYNAAGQATRHAKRELDRRNATYSFSRREWRAYIRRLRELTPSARLIEGETFPAYAEISQLNSSSIWHHALYAEVVKLHWQADSSRLYPELPEPSPPLTNDWLGEGVVIEFLPFYGPPVHIHWTDHDYLIHPDVHAVTYRLVVRRDRRMIGPEHNLGPPIELGEMTVEIPIEFRDTSIWPERFPEAYADE